MIHELVFVCTVRDGAIPRARTMLIEHWLSTQKDGEFVEVKIKRFGKRMSDAQRAYWFACIVKQVSEHCGYTPDEAHAELMYQLWPEGRRTIKRLDGTEHIVRGSLTKLSSAETTELIERAFVFCASALGIDVVAPPGAS